MTNYEMWIGNKFYSRESYIAEAKKMGASKKIGWIPHDLEIGKTRVYLISDMTELQRKTYYDEVRKRNQISHSVAAKINKNLSEGEEPARPVRTGFGPLPRGDPFVFGYFIVNGIVYVTKPEFKMSSLLTQRGVKPYIMTKGDFGTNDERGCGSLQDDSIYLISEESIEKIKELHSSPDLYSKNVHTFEYPIPYVGKRFRGIQDATVERASK
jgi:hypothetical protein